MATFQKTNKGRWKATIRKQGFPTKSLTFNTKRDASDWARTTEDQMVRGIYIDRAPSERMTLKVAMQRYLKEVTPTKKETTQKAEKYKSKPIIEAIGDYSLAAITAEIAADYRDERINSGLANNTVRLELALLSHLFEVAKIEWGLGLIYNPIKNIRKPSAGRGRNRRLEGDEGKRLLKACAEYSNPMLYWIVGIALHSGMRAGEIRYMKRDNVFLDRKFVIASNTKNGEERVVPLNSKAVKLFKEAMDYKLRPIDTRLLFWGYGKEKKGDIKPYQYKTGWTWATKKAGISGLTFHDLRHEAVSRLVELGLSDQEVSSVSGHKSMQMLKRYTHLRAEDLAKKLG